MKGYRIPLPPHTQSILEPINTGNSDIIRAHLCALVLSGPVPQMKYCCQKVREILGKFTNFIISYVSLLKQITVYLLS